LAELIKVLLVDDSAGVRELLTAILSEHGFRVMTAEDGLMGLKIAEAQRPDLIITDIDMPHLDGIQMIARLRGQMGFSGVPILVVSACGGEEAAAVLGAGADLVMQKPIDLSSFINYIDHLLPAKTA
jgi:DNA-binding response OmpR family regulator